MGFWAVFLQLVRCGPVVVLVHTSYFAPLVGRMNHNWRLNRRPVLIDLEAESGMAG